MNDLISRKALLIEFNSMEMPAIDIITGVIESQPTAYDPDKVVEAVLMLKDDAEWDEAVAQDDRHIEIAANRLDAFDKAIDIVKKGGVE